MDTLKDMDWDQFRAELEDAVGKVCDQYGIHMEFGNVSGTPDMATMKTTIVKATNSADAERVKFEHYAAKYGFEPSDYMRGFMAEGKHYCLVGFKPTGRKNTTIIMDDNGKRYITSHVAVHMLINEN